METGGIDRLGALHASIDLVRRGGTVSLSGVYGGQASPLPLLTLFDKQIQVRMGQANVKAWIDDLVTHRLPLEDAPGAYEMFQKKTDGCVKVVLDPKESR